MSASKVLAKKLNYFGSLQTVDHRFSVHENNTESITSRYGLFRFKVENKTIYVAWGKIDLAKYLKAKTAKVSDIFGHEEVGVL